MGCPRIAAIATEAQLVASGFALGVGIGKDHTLFALVAGRVRFHAGKLGRKYVSVDMPAMAAE